MNTVKQTDAFKNWLKNLKDIQAKAAIARRIKRLQGGLFGDCKSLGGGLFEMRIDTGKGWRVYYFQTGNTIYILIHGGNKSTQQADIATARNIQQQIKGA